MFQKRIQAVKDKRLNSESRVTFKILLSHKFRRKWNILTKRNIPKDGTKKRKDKGGKDASINKRRK
jgi:hypothetical protein